MLSKTVNCLVLAYWISSGVRPVQQGLAPVVHPQTENVVPDLVKRALEKTLIDRGHLVVRQDADQSGTLGNPDYRKKSVQRRPLSGSLR